MAAEHTPDSEQFNSRLHREPIAIIGMAGLFPQAANLVEYWRNIVSGIDCITDVPASRWDVEAYYHPDPRAPDRTYCKRGGFMPGVDFNPLDFGLPPNTLEVTDISQLLALVVARRAMEDAGYGEGRDFDRERVGVVLGVALARQLAQPFSARLEEPVWRKVLGSCGLTDAEIARVIERLKLAYVPWDENAFPGMLANVVAGRIANRLDFGGMNCVVDAACASSLGALRLAISELHDRTCDMVLTGGVDTDNSVFAYLCFSKTPALSRSQHVRPFDAGSDGMMLGEGIGMVVLKRLADAERDGDRIYALIRGIGAASDGRFKSIYAPRSEGQMRALRRAYEDAGCSPATVGLVEAHGTGTLAGDPTEFAALKAVYAEAGVGPACVALGSVKSQIGHTKAAAGAASLIKVALALHHKILPPTINVEAPNPKLGIESSPFYLNTATRPWIGGETPRRAALSSFGFGGSNYHVVLEEYQQEHESAYRLHPVARTVLLAADTPEALGAQCEVVAARLTGEGAERAFAELAEGSRTLALPATAARLGFVAVDASEACERLLRAAARLGRTGEEEAWEEGGVLFRRAALDLDGKVVALFAGQGAQYLEMGREAALNFPALRRAFADMDRVLVAEGAGPVSPLVFAPPAFTAAERQAQVARLQRTEHAQPAIGALSLGLYRLLREAGLRPDFALGHSYGELGALWAAGVFGDEDYCRLTAARARAMAGVGGDDPGAMLAVSGGADEARQLAAEIPGLYVANLNSPRQVVLAGGREAVEQAVQRCAEWGLSAVRLPVAAAFHTPLVSDACHGFAAALETVAFREPTLPVFANTSTEPYPADPGAMRALLKAHIGAPVRFEECIENVYAAGGRCFIEFGPRGILTNLVADILGERPHLVVALNPSRTGDSDHQLREAILRLRVAGLPLGDPDAYQAVLPAVEPSRHGQLHIHLESVNYVSDKTKQAFEQALQAGAFVSREAPRIDPHPNGGAPVPASQPLPPGNLAVPHTNGRPSDGSLASHPADRLDYLFAQQEDSLVLHRQVIEQQREYTRTAFELLAHAQAPTVAHHLLRFHRHHAQTLEVYQYVLADQSECTEGLAAAVQGLAPALTEQPVQRMVEPAVRPLAVVPPALNFVPSAAAVEPAPPPLVEATVLPVVAVDGETMGRALIEVVSEKTGYPAEMLTLEMDMEADLGIDSIKRVEILGALQDRFPDMPRPDPEELAELSLRTLGQVVGYLQQRLETDAKKASAPGPDGGSARGAAPIARRIVIPRFLSTPDRRRLALPEGHCCLVSDDGTPLTATVVERLRGWGWQVETLALPAELSEEDLQARFAAVAAPVAVFLHLHPPVAAEGVTGITEVDIALVRRVFLSARALKEPLCTASELGFAAFVAVVRLDGSLGLGGGEFATVGAGLFGLVKTLGIEWPGVFCRGIDLAPDLEVDAAAERLLAELTDPNRLVVEVGLSRAGRVTLDAVLQEVAIPEIAEHSLLVLSGGGRGITARCATRLAERYRCRFLLLGRSAATVAEPPGAETVVGEAELKRLIYDELQRQEEKPAPAAVSARYEAIRATREIRATLEAIRAAGGTAEYLQVDITDREALATALPPVLERLGPVSGIVHGAGNLADRRIERKSAADFERVFAPKVRGLANLLACLPTDQLRHLVLFSSVVGFYGNAGQTDYAMANEVLNKAAHRLTRQLPNCRTVAIGWGPWEAGMVSAELKTLFQAHGVETISAAQGADLLLAELGANDTQVILGSALPRPLGALPPPGERVIRRLSLAANPFLADHVIQGNPVLPATCALAWLANTCEQLYPGYRFHTAEHYRVLKGIVFDANCPEEFTVEVTRETWEAERLVCEAKVLSTTPDGRTRYHYSARLTLVRLLPAPPRDLALAQEPTPGPAPTDALYQSGEGSLFHGPTFQGVRRILALTPEQIILECVLPPLDARVQGQFPVQAFDPYAADIEIHSTWLWLERTHGQICLPTAIERFEQFTLIPPGAVFYVSMRLRARTETSITVDVLAHDADGHLYSRMLAAQGTVLVRRQLVH